MLVELARKTLSVGKWPLNARKTVLAGALLTGVLTMACSSSISVGDGGPNTPTDAAKTVQARQTAPTFAVETFRHGTYDLDQSIGRPVVINFWFPSCPPCRAEMPDLQAAYEEYGTEVDFVGVQLTGIDTVQDGKDFLDDLGITYPNFADNGEHTDSLVQFDYEVLNYPTTVFLNRDHKIHRTWTGIINEDNLHQQIETVIES